MVNFSKAERNYENSFQVLHERPTKRDVYVMLLIHFSALWRVGGHWGAGKKTEKKGTENGEDVLKI
jgi:hypothetical protein